MNYTGKFRVQVQESYILDTELEGRAFYTVSLDGGLVTEGTETINGIEFEVFEFDPYKYVMDIDILDDGSIITEFGFDYDGDDWNYDYFDTIEEAKAFYYKKVEELCI